MTELFRSTPDNDGDALTVHTWTNTPNNMRDRAYLLNFAIDTRVDSRYPALMDREDVEKLVTALAEHLGWDVVEEMSQEDIARTQHDADVALAKALVPGTIVRIAHTPLWDRDTTTAVEGRGLGAVHGDSTGVVTHRVFGSQHRGVNAGRVVVTPNIDEWDGVRHDGSDIHVSSLTPVEGEPSGFIRDTLASLVADYRVGDLVVVGDNPTLGTGPHSVPVTSKAIGVAGTVLQTPDSDGDALIRVGPNHGCSQFIHVSGLTNVSAQFRADDLAAGGVL